MTIGKSIRVTAWGKQGATLGGIAGELKRRGSVPTYSNYSWWEVNMARKVRRERVRYIVDEPVEIEAGVMLPPGRYDGLLEQGGYETLQGVEWTPPQYRLEVLAEKAAKMGKTVRPNDHSFGYELSRFISKGLIHIAQRR